jgi:hypothetical protein
MNMNTIMTSTKDDKLDRLAVRIKTDIDRCEHSREDWVEATLDLAEALAEAREHFRDNPGFGRWIDENQLLISKNDRAALIAFGQDIERARLILGQTESRSLRLIYTKEFHLPSTGKMKNPKTPKSNAPPPKVQKAYDTILELERAGVEFNRTDVEERAGVSNTPARRAWERRQAEKALLQEAPDVAGMPKTWKDRYDAAITRKVAQLEAEYDERRMAQVRKHIDEYILPLYADKLAKAERLMEISKKPFTVDEYRQLLAALHPDSTPDRRAKVFTMVKDREHLLRPPERDKPFTSDLPKTLDELLKRRKPKGSAR